MRRVLPSHSKIVKLEFVDKGRDWYIPNVNDDVNLQKKEKGKRN